MTDFDTSYPPSLWEPAAVPATGATAGIPGTWTPTDSQAPATVAALQGGIPNAVVASPATAWTAGQYVQTRTAGAAGQATWTGTQWVGGVAPAIQFTPVGHTIAEVQAFIEGLGEPDDEDVIAETQRVLDIERANGQRTTLIAWLDERLGVT
jgi:hypothetical protein